MTPNFMANSPRRRDIFESTTQKSKTAWLLGRPGGMDNTRYGSNPARVEVVEGAAFHQAPWAYQGFAALHPFA